MSDDEKIEIAKLWREVMDVWVRGFDYTKGYPRHLTDPYGRGIKDALGQLCPSLQQRPLDQRWSNPADTQSFLHDRDRPNAKEYQERLMEFYRHYPHKPEYLYKNEQQTKKAMTKFKKGDRVKVIRESSINLGCEGVVTHTFPDSRSYTVDLDDMGSVAFSESSLTLVDQPISTTPDKVLQAAKTSPQAKDALKALFPDVFKDELYEFGNRSLRIDDWGTSPLFIGDYFAPIGLGKKCLIVHDDWEMKTQQHNGRTILTFHKKP